MTFDQHLATLNEDYVAIVARSSAKMNTVTQLGAAYRMLHECPDLPGVYVIRVGTKTSLQYTLKRVSTFDVKEDIDVISHDDTDA